MHSITCYTLYTIFEQDLLKVRSCILLLSLPEKGIKSWKEPVNEQEES